MLIKTRQGNIICLKERINFKFFSFFIFCAIISKLFNGYLELIIGSSAPCRCFAKDKPVYPKWLVRKLTGVIRYWKPMLFVIKFLNAQIQRVHKKSSP